MDKLNFALRLYFHEINKKFEIKKKEKYKYKYKKYSKRLTKLKIKNVENKLIKNE